MSSFKSIKEAKMHEEGEKDIDKLIKAFERERDKLDQKRQAKIALLKKALAKAGLLKELALLGDPETDDAKNERIASEAKMAAEQLRSLNKMVTFWEMRLAAKQKEVRAARQEQWGSERSEKETPELSRRVSPDIAVQELNASLPFTNIPSVGSRPSILKGGLTAV